MRKYDWARKKSALLSFGVPIGALAVVAGCAGGGTVAGTRVVRPTAPIAGGTPAPTIPVTILINPPVRTASRKRSVASRGLRYQVPYTTSGVVKIGVTAFVGSSTPSPGPTETVFTLPAPISSASPSPYPVTVNVPIGSDTFVIHEYNGSTGAPDLYPNGYLLSTYTSASPVPIYLNATNRVAITTVPVVTSLSFYPTSVALLENQAAAQTTNVNVNLADAEGNTIVGTVANPVTLQSSTSGVLSGASVAVAQTTAVPIGYPAGSHTASTVTATVNALPGSLAVQPSPLPVNPDFYLFASQTSVGTAPPQANVFRAGSFLAGYKTTPESTVALPSTFNPNSTIGVQPGCGVLAQAMIGGSADSVSFVSFDGTKANVVTASVASGFNDTRAIALNPNSCTGYAVANSSGQGYLYSANLSAGSVQFLQNLPSASGSAVIGLAIDASASTAYYTDYFTGYLNAYSIGSSTSSLGSSSASQAQQIVYANGRIFQSANIYGKGYLYAYATPSAAPVNFSIGPSPSALIASPDGNSIFVGGIDTSVFPQVASVYYIDNSGASVPVATSASTAIPLAGATVNAMVVSPDGTTLYVVGGTSNSSVLYSYALGNLSATHAFPSPSPVAPSLPAGTISLGISP